MSPFPIKFKERIRKKKIHFPMSVYKCGNFSGDKAYANSHTVHSTSLYLINAGPIKFRSTMPVVLAYKPLMAGL